MSSLNKVMLIGHLGADPEERTFQNGGGVVNIRLATSERWKDKGSGEMRERTEWHTVCIFADGLRDIAKRYLKKGSKVFIEGKLQTRKWQDQNGNDRYSTEVVLQAFAGQLIMLGDGSSSGQRNNNREDRSNPRDGWESNHTGGGGGGYASGGYDDLDDDIPF